MNKKFSVVQVGLGPMGQLIANLLLKRQNISYKGVVDIDPKLANKKLGSIIDQDSNLIVRSNFEDLLSKETPDISIIATSSSLEKVAPLIKQAVVYGSNVISLCEELSYPYTKYPDLSEDLDSLARSSEVSILGTGINPGYLMDVLPIIMTAPCQNVDSIKVTRMMNSGKRREPFQRKIGTGLSIEQFKEKISKKDITGHVGLEQSIQMISVALGFTYDEIKEFTPEAIVAEEEFTTSYGERVLKGNVCGLKCKAGAFHNNKEFISLDFFAYVGDHEEYDSIEIKGVPNIHQKVIGGVHGDIGTAGMIVNLIPKLMNSPSGLLTMKDISLPCYTANLWKT
jgi:2,4-diaminopentanoate dehydrogenase